MQKVFNSIRDRSNQNKQTAKKSLPLPEDPTAFMKWETGKRKWTSKRKRKGRGGELQPLAPFLFAPVRASIFFFPVFHLMNALPGEGRGYFAV